MWAPFKSIVTLDSKALVEYPHKKPVGLTKIEFSVQKKNVYISGNRVFVVVAVPQWFDRWLRRRSWREFGSSNAGINGDTNILLYFSSVAESARARVISKIWMKIGELWEGGAEPNARQKNPKARIGGGGGGMDP